jgi:tetratricopeptide (TPR) repeat protein
MGRGQTLFAQGDYVRASVEFRNALQILPQNPQAKVMAARTAEKLGNMRLAASLYRSVINEVPDDVDAHVGLGRLLALTASADATLKLIEPVLAKHPNDPRLLVLRGAARTTLKDTAAGTADVDRALQLDPSNEDAIALRAALYKNAGDLAQAATLLSNALQRLPKSQKLHEILADVYEVAGDSDKAEEQVRALINLSPQDPRYRNELAQMYERVKRTDDAQHVLEEAVRAAPKSNEAKLTLVDFVARTRSTTDAQAMLRRFISDQPDNEDLRLALATRLAQIGHSGDAADVYEEVIKRDNTGPAGLAARNGLAVIDVSYGRYEEARKLLEQILAANPRDTAALSLRGDVSLYQGDPTSAIADFRALALDQPRSANVQQLLARAYEASGDNELAEQAQRSAMEMAPADASLRLGLGELLMRTRRAAEAVPVLEEAVRRAPQSVAARGALVQAYLAKPDLAAAHQAADDIEKMPGQAATGAYYAGTVAERAGKPDEAQRDYERALADEPKAYAALDALAMLERKRQGPAQAVKVVKDAVDRTPNEPVPVNLLGDLYLADKDYPLAIETFTRATQLAPNWATPHRNLAVAKLISQDVPGAISEYRTAIKAAPNDPNLVTELGQVYASHGQIDQAFALYEECYQRDPHARLIARDLAVMLVTYRTDRSSLDRAHELTAPFALTNDARLLDASGWVSVKRGESRSAIPVLQRAVQRAPSAPEIRYHLGIAEMQTGDSQRARQDLEKAVADGAKASWSEQARVALAQLKTQAS